MKKKSYAKINLILDVIEKRQDGYHNIDGIMQMIDLYDEVEVKISDKFEITSNSKDIPLDEKNLVYKVYKALKENHFAVNVTDVVGISCPNVAGALAKVLRYLSDEGVFIEYMYSFANNQTANVVIRPNDMENCIRVLTEKKVDLLAASDLYKL